MILAKPTIKSVMACFDSVDNKFVAGAIEGRVATKQNVKNNATAP